MSRKIRENHSPHFQFDKDVVCKAFSEVLSREYGREVVFTFVKKEEQDAKCPNAETV